MKSARIVIAVVTALAFSLAYAQAPKKDEHKHKPGEKHSKSEKGHKHKAGEKHGDDDKPKGKTKAK